MLNNLKTSLHNTIKRIVKQLIFEKSKLSFSERRLLANLQDYTLSQVIIDNYRECVKNNSEDSVVTIKSKLIRNIVLGRLIGVDNFVRSYQYGNLVIWIDRHTKEIYKLVNFKGHYRYDVDMDKKSYLDTYFGIESKKNEHIIAFDLAKGTRIEFENGSVIQEIPCDSENVRSKGFHIEMDGVNS